MDSLSLRPGTPADAPAAARIAYDAFHAIATRHAFPPDLPSVEVAHAFLADLLARDDVYAVVAERDGTVVGSNFLWTGDPMAAVGPITVDPAAQDGTVGRRLMTAVLDHATARRARGVRLVQAAYHNRSLALYTRLGFDPREPLSNLQGPPLGVAIPGRTVRPARPEDAAAVTALGTRLLGVERTHEFRVALDRGTASVVEHGGRVTGYTTGVAFFGHALGERNEDVQALIGAATAFGGPGLIVPTRNAALLRWCLDHGLRIVQPLTLMSLGEYADPRGAFLPSILY